VLAGGRIYIGSEDGAVYALDAQSGAPLRKYVTGGKVSGTPVVQDGVLYIGSHDTYLYAFTV
jgi:outer membrane protein assembly factor BamB